MVPGPSTLCHIHAQPVESLHDDAQGVRTYSPLPKLDLGYRGWRDMCLGSKLFLVKAGQHLASRDHPDPCNDRAHWRLSSPCFQTTEIRIKLFFQQVGVVPNALSQEDLLGLSGRCALVL